MNNLKPGEEQINSDRLYLRLNTNVLERLVKAKTRKKENKRGKNIEKSGSNLRLGLTAQT